jgi:hypothetical protein
MTHDPEKINQQKYHQKQKSKKKVEKYHAE